MRGQLKVSQKGGFKNCQKISSRENRKGGGDIKMMNLMKFPRILPLVFTPVNQSPVLYNGRFVSCSDPPPLYSVPAGFQNISASVIDWENNWGVILYR